MKICITGGTGFVGRWFLKKAPEEFYCVVLSRDITHSDISRGEVIKTDYSCKDLKSIFEDQSFDAVVHLAGKKISKEYEFLDYIRTNTLLTDKLLRLCVESSVENVVTASSRLVYSEENTLPWNESDSPIPMTYYGLSKLLADKLGLYYSKKHKIKCKSLRFAQIFGIDSGRDIIHTGLFRTFINKAIENRPLPIYGEGEDEKEYIYVKDSVNAIFSALNVPEEYGIFNIGLGENKTVLNIADLINDVFENGDNDYRFLRDKEERNESNLLDISKSEKVLDFYPNWSIKEALIDMKEIIEDGCVKVRKED